ncbi:MAG: GNAT family acetyltransferase [Gammaproteobacteria bacterium]|nr:GNAT family acetyltransferase [Gammaproteobacteria bacterium]
MTGLAIRPYEERDADLVVALWRACGLVVPWNDPLKDIERKLRVQRELFLVGSLSGRLVATVMAGYEGHRGWINYLAVAQECRRQGLGRQMMDAAEVGLRAMGCPKINLQIRKSNPAAIGFYRSLGFVEDETVSMGKRLVED